MNGQICPRVNCGTMFESDIGYLCNVAICPKCRFNFCILCYEQSHPNESCSNNSNVLDPASMKTISKMKKCPKCKVPTERSSGCNHMTCQTPGCNMEWCFICKIEWDFECMRNHWGDIVIEDLLETVPTDL